MERDSSVKRLDFEDVSITLHDGAASAVPADGNDTSELSAAPSGSSVEDLGAICSVACRQEAQRIRESLTRVDAFVNSFGEPFIQKVNAEAEGEPTSAKQLKRLYSMLSAESLEIAAKEGFLGILSEWQLGDEMIEEKKRLTKVADTDNMGDELTTLKNRNAEAILEIESLIRSIAKDVNGLQTDISDTSGCLDAFDLEKDNLAEEEGTVACRDNIANGHLTVPFKQPEDLQDLESTIWQLEETLRQNEKDYVEAEAAMETRIEQYNLEIAELQAQASQLDREEECMRMLIDVTARFLQSQKQMECSNDVSLVSVEDGCIDLRLTTYVPSVDDHRDAMDQQITPWEHNLHIKINHRTMEIEEAKLTPEDVSIDDLLAVAQEKRSITSASLEAGKEGELAEFGPQLVCLVKAVHQRLIIHAFQIASVSSGSSDPRYSVEYKAGSPVITVTKPGKLKASVEVPQNWPMHGHSLRLQSLHSLDAESTDLSTPAAMNAAVDVANKLPEYVRHDLLTFVQALEKIVS